MNDVSVVVTASPIPSHPSDAILLQTLRSLSKLGVDDSVPVLLAHDGVRPDIRGTAIENRYELYLRGLKDRFGHVRNVEICVAPEWLHLAGNISQALSLVQTRYVLIVQHDLPFVRTCNLQALLEVMNSYPMVKHVRFNRFNSAYEGADSCNASRKDFLREESFEHSAGRLNLVRTLHWSDNNHLCRPEYYQSVILPLIGERRRPPEIVSGLATSRNHGVFGTYIFGGMFEPALIEHLDGRLTEAADADHSLQGEREVRTSSKTWSERSFIRKLDRVSVAGHLPFRSMFMRTERAVMRMKLRRSIKHCA